MIIEEDTYVSHYGVKGMHWGTRRTRSGKVKLNAVGIAASVGAGLLTSNAASVVARIAHLPIATGVGLSSGLGIAGGIKAARILREKGELSLKNLPK